MEIFKPAIIIALIVLAVIGIAYVISVLPHKHTLTLLWKERHATGLFRALDA